MRRLLPSPADGVDPAEAYADPERVRQGDRPWVLVNMVVSVDGATALDGVSGGLGGAGDRTVFRVLRDLADVILVGAGTMRAERYRAPRRTGQRIGVVTRSAALDWDSGLFASGAGFVVTTEDAPPVPVPAIRAGVGSVDLAGALRQLDTAVLLCEGGPSLNGELARLGLVDEWCTTVAPLLVGGASRRASVGDVAAPVGLRLVHLLEHDGELYCRYLRA